MEDFGKIAKRDLIVIRGLADQGGILEKKQSLINDFFPKFDKCVGWDIDLKIVIEYI